MSTFAKKLRRDVIDPATEQHRVYTYKAQVTKKGANSENKCTIKYIDENGYKRTSEGVRILIYGNDSMGGWVPEVGDIVIAEKDENNVISVVAKDTSNFTDYFEQYRITKDIYSTLGNDVSPGTLF